MHVIGSLPTTEELEQVADRLIHESDDRKDIMLAVGAIFECIALRDGIEHVLKTCTDRKTVAYLRDLREKIRH